MADCPTDHPEIQFHYPNRATIGFEYTATVRKPKEGMEEEGPRLIEVIWARYDGGKRSPFDEAECGHHYGRAMASWAAVPAWTGFQWSGVTGTMRFAAWAGNWFWSNGEAWGTCHQSRIEGGTQVTLEVLYGSVDLRRLEVIDVGVVALDEMVVIRESEALSWRL